MERSRRIKYLQNMIVLRSLSVLLAVFLAAALAACGRPPQVFVPTQATAQQQYAYAVNYKGQHELILRNKSEKERWERTRAAVWESFSKVAELYPEDRTVTPLAKLEMADMKAGLDFSGNEPSKEDLNWAIERLQELQRDYPELDFVQAKARYDEGLCWKNMERYDRSQVLFKEVIDKFATHKDPVIQAIVERSNVFYQRTYVK